MAEEKKAKKPGIFSRMGKYLRDTKGEFKKVIWPTKDQTKNNTIVVLVMVCISGVFIFGLDTLLGVVLRTLLKLA